MLIILYFLRICASGIGHWKIRLAWESQQEPKSIRAEPECRSPDFVDGFRFDLLTQSVRVGWSRGAKLLQGLILSPCLTVNSWWNPPLALSASCQEGTSRPPCKDRTTLGRVRGRAPSSDCPQVTWFVLFCVIHLPQQLPHRRGCCFDKIADPLCTNNGLWSPLLRLDSSSSQSSQW